MNNVTKRLVEVYAGLLFLTWLPAFARKLATEIPRFTPEGLKIYYLAVFCLFCGFMALWFSVQAREMWKSKLKKGGK